MLSVVVIFIVDYLVDLTCRNGFVSIISSGTVKAITYRVGS